MRYFMKFYPDCTIGTVEQVDDSMTLLSGNDEKGVFNWIEVFDKQQLATARREGWEQCQKEAQAAILDHFTCCDFQHGCNHDWCNMLKEIADAIAAMEYKEENVKNLIRKWLGIVEVKQLSDRELRKMIGEAVVDALSGDFGNTLTNALEKAPRETTKAVSAKSVENRVGGEAFIDEIIDRIRRKQLSA